VDKSKNFLYFPFHNTGFCSWSGIVLALDDYCFSQEGLSFHARGCILEDDGWTFWRLRVDYISLLAGVLHTPICVCFGVSPLRRDGDPSVYLVEFELQTVVDL
jgi:hypothetical protein